MVETTKGIQAVSKRRTDHINKHLITIPVDVINNDKGQLMDAAKNILEEPLVLRASNRPVRWEVSWWWNMCKQSKKERIEIAASFLIAEWDRLDALETGGTDHG